MKKFFLRGFLISIPILIFAITVELFFTIELSGKRIYEYDAEIGWVPKKNFTYNRRRVDKAGNSYDVSLTTNEYGFRAWGDIDTEKIKIFFLGDSYTGDPNMSDADSYFVQAGRILDAEVFALGGGGYSTLQELMVLRRYIGIIDPDYFVLQFCSNDFVNNSFSLEEKWIVSNQKNLRPYLVNDKIIYRLPAYHWYRLFYRFSATFRYLDYLYQGIQYKRYNGRYPPSARDKKKEMIKKEYSSADQVTGKLLEMMADSVPKKTGLLTFSCDTKNGALTRKWIRIAESAGFTPLPSVSRAIEQAEAEGIVVRTADGGHWAPRAHRIAGKVLAAEIRKAVNSKR